MTEKEQTTTIKDPEAIQAYTDEAVMQALNNCDWFTTEYIEYVQSTVADPERKGLGPFENKFLADFFMIEYTPSEQGDVFRSANMYLIQRLVSMSGHPYPLHAIEFLNEQQRNEIIQKFDLPENFEFDRSIHDYIAGILRCIIAPTKIRDEVIKVICSWGSDVWKKNILTWAEVVKIGAQAYVQRKK